MICVGALHHGSKDNQGEGTSVTSCGDVPPDVAKVVLGDKEFKLATKRNKADLSKAVLVTYKDGARNLIYVPIPATNGETKALWVYVEPRTNTVVGVAEFSIKPGKAQEDRTITLSKADGTEMGRLRYEGGQLVEKWTADTGSITIQGEDWNCFWNCLLNYWKNIPDPVKWVCSYSCLNLCAAGKNPYGCTACAICLGAWGAFCHGYCWS